MSVFKNSEELNKFILENDCVVVKISAKWCGPCKDATFLENYHKLKDTVKLLNCKFIELDLNDNSNLINDTEFYDFDVEAVPTLLVFKHKLFSKYTGTACLNNIYNDIISNKKNKNSK